MQRVVAELTEEKVAVDIYRQRRDAFIEALGGLEYARPEGTFYLFCKVPPKKHGPVEGPAAPLSPDGEFVNHLKKHLILGVPGSSFKKACWVRFAYCVDERIIRNSAAAFKEALASW
jgi:aspartate aminotransferase